MVPLGPFTVGPKFMETVYISEVNEARKVESDAQVALSKNSDPVRKLFSYKLLGNTVPQLNFFQTSGIVRNE